MNFQFQIRNYKKQNGEQAIRLRFFTSANDLQYLDSGVSVLKNQWDDKKQLVKKHPLEEQLNASLTALLNDVRMLYYKNEGISAKRLLQIYKNSKQYNTSSFLTFYQELVDEMKLKGNFRSAKTNQQYINKLQKFSSSISFSDITPLWAKEYERWQLKKGNKTNTIASNFKGINAVLNQAVKLGLLDRNPLKGFFTIKEENTRKNPLSIEEIKAETFVIPARFKSMVLARDMFLFSFYTAGMRFTDMCKLKWGHISETEIIYIMNKSAKRAGARRYIPITDKVRSILEKYERKKDFVFPILQNVNPNDIQAAEYAIFLANNKLNRGLKKVAQHLGITKNVSLHIGKHSFADYAVKNNVDILHISKLLGHTKLSTTEYYLKDFYNKEQADIMNKLFSEDI